MSETLQMPDEQSETIEAPRFVASEEDRLKWRYMIPGNPEHDWVIRNANKMDRKDGIRRRRQVLPKAIVIPPKMSFDLSSMKMGEEPERIVKPAGHLLTFYDTGASVEQMTARNHPCLGRDQNDLMNAGLYGPSYYDERKIRASACWKEKGSPGWRQLLLYPAYGWTSVANGVRFAKMLRVLSFNKNHQRHVPMRVMAMAMMLFHNFKKEAVKGEVAMLARPGVLVSSSRVNGQYVCATYDSIRIALTLHDGSATKPWSLYYPFGLAMEKV